MPTPADSFRDYGKSARSGVDEFYQLHHQHQTVDLVRAKQAQFLNPDGAEMGIWQAMEFLNTLVDDSDPDVELSQIAHLMQTAEAIRSDGHPDWFILTDLLHDLGKILCLWGEPQWAVVGDTLPVGCGYSQDIVLTQYLSANADSEDERYQSRYGIYTPVCALSNVLMTWGHDEYLYHVLKDYLPEQALYMIRFHSCYPVHTGATTVT